MFKPSRILVPTDFSETSLKAVQQAFDIAKQHGAEVFLVHVVDRPASDCAFDYCISEEQVKPIQAKMEESARKEIQNQLSKIPDMGSVKVSPNVRMGTPYEEILNEADVNNVDLIVISSFGFKKIARLLLGSVARQVMMGAVCSVLLVR